MARRRVRRKLNGNQALLRDTLMNGPTYLFTSQELMQVMFGQAFDANSLGQRRLFDQAVYGLRNYQIDVLFADGDIELLVYHKPSKCYYIAETRDALAEYQQNRDEITAGHIDRQGDVQHMIAVAAGNEVHTEERQDLVELDRYRKVQVDQTVQHVPAIGV